MDGSSFIEGHGAGDLIACPECDALYRVGAVPAGSRAVCARCHTVLVAPRRRAGMAIISLAVAAVILLGGALFLPFLHIGAAGLSRGATLLDVATSIVGGPLGIVSGMVMAAIVILPALRAVLLLYTLAPVVFDRRPLPGAPGAFRAAERLKPWSMSEIFVIGCIVSLTKIADLAAVSLGPAFWMFLALVVVTVIQDRLVDRWSVWRSIGAE